MHKFSLAAFAALSVALLFGTATLPASAATPAQDSMSNITNCDADASDISDDSTDIAKRLSAKGYQVDSIQTNGGCIEAYVKKDGVAQILQLDPLYLNPVGSQPQLSAPMAPAKTTAKG